MKDFLLVEKDISGEHTWVLCTRVIATAAVLMTLIATLGWIVTDIL